MKKRMGGGKYEERGREEEQEAETEMMGEGGERKDEKIEKKKNVSKSKKGDGRQEIRRLERDSSSFQ